MHSRRQLGGRFGTGSERNSPGPGWTTFRSHGVESSRTRNSPESAGRAYPYTGLSGYECMPTVRSDAAGPFGRNIAATALVRRVVRGQASALPWFCAGGFPPSSKLKRFSSGVMPTSWPRPGNRWRIPIGSGRSGWGRGRWSGDVCSPTTARDSIRVHKPVTCKLWDHKGLDEAGLALTADGRRRLVAPPWEPGDPA